MAQKPSLVTDVLVLGSGIAGLIFALKAATKHKVLIVTKKESSEANTNYAQGGIAAVMNSLNDSEELHIQDTHKAGAGLNDPEAVEILVKEGRRRVEELIGLGIEFTRLDDKSLSLGREGGHSQNRIVHTKDATGRAVEKGLLKKIAENPNITLLDFHHAIDLITTWHLGINTKENICIGCYVYDDAAQNVITVSAKATMIATGGAGRVYEYTTNPLIATGDGIGIGYRAGCKVINMEFYQFHPTSLYSGRKENRSFLISEAVRGEGGILRDPNGRAFMPEYHELKDLAPRDIVARSIDAEMKPGAFDHMYLDITHLDPDDIVHEFPHIYNTCLDRYGLDIRTQQIPVVPAAHYMNGGVKTDLHGRTDITGLFAAGEVTWTGVHGANRLASNSLLEGLVFASRAAEFLLEQGFANKNYLDKVEPWHETGADPRQELLLINHNTDEIGKIMGRYVGIVRSDFHLDIALRRIDTIYREIREIYNRNRIIPELVELRNLVLVAQLIIRSARSRKESRGLHFTTDYPESRDVGGHNSVLQNQSVVRPKTPSN